MQEEWRDIKDYEGLYQVSNLGRVRGLDRATSDNRKWKGKILKTHIVKQYVAVILHKDGRYKNYYIHRLVAQAFIPNPDNLPEINHKDEDKTNNRVDNLEWCSVLYNNTYCNRHKKIGENLYRPILQYTINGEFVKKWPSIKSANKYFTGKNHSSINHALCDESKKYDFRVAYGYVWKYEDSLNGGK